MDAWLQSLRELAQVYRIPFTGLAFLLGLCIGSFLNVCIYRLPEKKSLVWPESFCPKCRKHIRWYDNIPLVSFVVLGGKCRFCRSPISIRYFVVELTSGLALGALFLYWGLTPKLLWAAYLVFSLLIVTFVDFQKMIIPDEITITGIFAGGLFALAFPEVQGELSHRLAFGESMLGVLVGGGLVWITAFVGGLVFKRESMGGGDLKLMAMIGAFLGAKGAILTFFVAPFLALPFGLFQKWVRKTDILAYGPFLAMAAVFNLFFSDWLLNVILGQ